MDSFENVDTFMEVTSYMLTGISITGVVLNMQVLFILSRHSSDSVFSLLLMLLSLLDFVQLSTQLLLRLPELHDKDTEILSYRILQMILSPTMHVSLSASWWTIVLLAMERYIGAYYPFKSRINNMDSLSRRRTFLRYTIIVIFLSLLTKAPYLTEYQVHTSPSCCSISYTPFSWSSWMYEAWVVLYMTILLLEIIFLLVTNCRIYQIVHNHTVKNKIRNRLSQKIDLAKEITKRNEDRKCFIILSSIAVLALITSIPIIIKHISSFFIAIDTAWMAVLGRIIDILNVLNSSANFFIYFIAGKSYREVLLKYSLPATMVRNVSGLSVLSGVSSVTSVSSVIANQTIISVIKSPSEDGGKQEQNKNKNNNVTKFEDEDEERSL